MNSLGMRFVRVPGTNVALQRLGDAGQRLQGFLQFDVEKVEEAKL